MRGIFSKLALMFLGALLVFVVLEVVLRMLPVSMGLYPTEKIDRWPLHNFEPGLPYSYSITWAMLNSQRGITNNYGHISAIDFEENSHPIIVIGDSYIESLMNSYSDTIQGQLGEILGQHSRVYGLGVSGLSASDYIVLSRQAKDEFKPSAAIFLITDGDFSESLSSRPGNYYLESSASSMTLRFAQNSTDSALKRVRKKIGDIATYRYFQANLKFSFDDIFKSVLGNGATQAIPTRAVNNSVLQLKAVDWFLSVLPEETGLEPQCIVFLVDTDRYAIYDKGLASQPKDMPIVKQYFIDQANLLGFKVSDMDNVFRRSYLQDHLKFDYWPIDRHWNKVGHGLGAREAFRLLKLKSPDAKCGAKTTKAEQFDAK